MATQTVTVTVPDGVQAGDEFQLEFEGQVLAVICPDGCGAGDDINLEVEVPAAAAEEAPPTSVQVVVPDGCYPGMEFTVEFDGRQFNIAVPDGCEPGMELQVEVPPAEPEPEAAAPEPAPAPVADKSAYRDLRIPPYKGGKSASSSHSEWAPYAARRSNTRVDRPHPPVIACLRLPSPFALARANRRTHALIALVPLGSATSLFAMGPPSGFGTPAGDFHVGQLVQVTRSDGSWTYGKIMDYEDMGDTYTVMTKGGPKHFVERADLTDDIVVNPSDGSCAQQ